MSQKSPLVMNGGQIEQLQAADWLPPPVTISKSNGTAATMIPGTITRVDPGDSTVRRANPAAGSFDLAHVTGVVGASIAPAGSGPVVIAGAITLTTGEWDAITGQSGGLTPHSTYYLTGNGVMGLTAPSAPTEFLVVVGLATSSTTLIVRPTVPIEL